MGKTCSGETGTQMVPSLAPGISTGSPSEAWATSGEVTSGGAGYEYPSYPCMASVDTSSALSLRSDRNGRSTRRYAATDCSPPCVLAAAMGSGANSCPSVV